MFPTPPLTRPKQRFRGNACFHARPKALQLTVNPRRHVVRFQNITCSTLGVPQIRPRRIPAIERHPLRRLAVGLNIASASGAFTIGRVADSDQVERSDDVGVRSRSTDRREHAALGLLHHARVNSAHGVTHSASAAAVYNRLRHQPQQPPVGGRAPLRVSLLLDFQSAASRSENRRSRALARRRTTCPSDPSSVTGCRTGSPAAWRPATARVDGLPRGSNADHGKTRAKRCTEADASNRLHQISAQNGRRSEHGDRSV